MTEYRIQPHPLGQLCREWWPTLTVLYRGKLVALATVLIIHTPVHPSNL